MTTLKEKQVEMSTSKEQQYMQSPGNVPCSICLDVVESAGDRSTARLACGHHFHLDCIGSAFNAKGAMQCPNCRQVEGGQWLFASGCYLQQHLLRNNNADEDSNNYSGMHFNMVYRYDERVNDTSRRPPHGMYRQIPVESDYPSSTTNRWRTAASREVLPWNVPLDEIERPLIPEMDPPHVSGTYAQPMVMHRPSRHGNVLPDASHMFEGSMSRQRMEEDGLLLPYETTAGLTSGRRYARNRGVNERGVAFNLQLLPEFRVQGPLGNLEQSRFQDARFGQAGGDIYNTRRVGGYTSRNPIGHEWGNSMHHQDPSHRSFANGYINQVNRFHSLNRAMNSHSYDGHQVGASVPWI